MIGLTQETNRTAQGLHCPLILGLTAALSLLFFSKLSQNQFFDGRRDEALQVSSQPSYFFDDGTGQEAVFITSQKKNCFDRRVQGSVGHGDPKLVVEIGHGSEPANHALASSRLGIVNQQTLERRDFDVIQVLGAFTKNLHASLCWEERLLLAVHSNGDDEMIDQARTSFDDVQVPQGWGIE